MPPAINPANIPNPAAISTGTLAVRKFCFGLVGLLINISLNTMPMASEAEIHGNRTSSGICLSKPRSVKTNCPRFQPMRDDAMPANMYR